MLVLALALSASAAATAFDPLAAFAARSPAPAPRRFLFDDDATAALTTERRFSRRVPGHAGFDSALQVSGKLNFDVLNLDVSHAQGDVSDVLCPSADELYVAAADASELLAATPLETVIVTSVAWDCGHADPAAEDSAMYRRILAKPESAGHARTRSGAQVEVVRVQTEPLELTDLFEFLHASFTYLPPTDLAARRAIGFDADFDLFNFNYDAETQSAAEPLSFQPFEPFPLVIDCYECYSYLTLGIEFRLDLGLTGLKNFKLLLTGTHETNIEFGISVRGSVTQPIELFDITILPSILLGIIAIPAGPVPITINFNIGLDLRGELASGSFEVGPTLTSAFHYRTEAALGSRYEHDIWSDIGYMQPPYLAYKLPSFENPDNRVSARADLLVRLAAKISVTFGVILPAATLTLEIQPYAGANIEVPSPACGSRDLVPSVGLFWGVDSALLVDFPIDIPLLNTPIIPRRTMASRVCRDGKSFGDAADWATETPPPAEQFTYRVSILGAQNLQCPDDECDSYAIVEYCLGGCRESSKTNQVDNNDNPTYSHTALFEGVDGQGSLRITVRDDDFWSGDDDIAILEYELANLNDLCPADTAEPCTVPTIFVDGTNLHVDNPQAMSVRMRIERTPASLQHSYRIFDIAAIDAIDDCFAEVCDPYMKFRVGGGDDDDEWTYETAYQEDTEMPVWEDRFALHDVPALGTIEAQMANSDTFGDPTSDVVSYPVSFCSQADLRANPACSIDVAGFGGTVRFFIDRMDLVLPGVFTANFEAQSGNDKLFELRFPAEWREWATLAVYVAPTTGDPDLFVTYDRAEAIPDFNRAEAVASSEQYDLDWEILVVDLPAEGVSDSVFFDIYAPAADSSFYLYTAPTFTFRPAASFGRPLPVASLPTNGFFSFFFDLTGRLGASGRYYAQADYSGLIFELRADVGAGELYANYGGVEYPGGSPSAYANVLVPFGGIKDAAGETGSLYVATQVAVSGGVLSASVYADLPRFGVPVEYNVDSSVFYYFIAVPRRTVEMRFVVSGASIGNTYYSQYFDVGALPAAEDMTRSGTEGGIDVTVQPGEDWEKVFLRIESTDLDATALDSLTVSVFATVEVAPGQTAYGVAPAGSSIKYIVRGSDPTFGVPGATVRARLIQEGAAGIDFATVPSSLVATDPADDALVAVLDPASDATVELVVSAGASAAGGRYALDLVVSFSDSLGTRVADAAVPEEGRHVHTLDVSGVRGEWFGVLVVCVAEDGDPDLVASTVEADPTVHNTDALSDNVGSDSLALPFDSAMFSETAGDVVHIAVHTFSASKYTLYFEELLPSTVSMASRTITSKQIVDGGQKVTLTMDNPQWRFHPATVIDEWRATKLVDTLAWDESVRERFEDNPIEHLLLEEDGKIVITLPPIEGFFVTNDVSIRFSLPEEVVLPARGLDIDGIITIVPDEVSSAARPVALLGAVVGVVVAVLFGI